MPFDPGAAGARRRADSLGDIRPCRDCKAPVRVSYRSEFGLEIPVEVDPQPAGDTDRPGYLSRWHPHLGWQAYARHSQTNPHDPLYAAHTCAATPQPVRGHEVFGTPSPPGTTGPSSAELAGRLLIVKVNGIKTGIETKHGVADALQTDITDLTTGEEHADTLLFSRTLTNQLKPGVTYLGRLAKEEIGNGKTAWHFLDANSTPVDVETATKYLTYKAQQNGGAAPFVPPAATHEPGWAPQEQSAPTPVPAAGHAPPWA